MIETDGVGCSILLLRNDMIGKRIPKNKKNGMEKYIEDLDDYSKLQNKKIVSIDPGKEDLLYCVDNDNENANTFRYSQDRRRKETKSKKYMKIILELKKEKIDGKTIIEYEAELSKFNRKTLDIMEFKKYIQKKNEINDKLFEFYKKYIFRKLKLNGYMNRHKNEQKMINHFKKIFGNQNDVIITIGDFEQKKHMKYKEPTKGKGMRNIFRKNGYKLYLVDEFRTSCKCSKCEGGECNKFLTRENPKPYKSNLRLVHGLLSCKSCYNVWNRDCNGAKNIYKITYNIINKKDKPSYLCRKQSDVLHDTPKSKFTRSETNKPF
jgi:transposase